MALTGNLLIAVPTLPDNEVWFANAQAWNNYWKGIGGTATIKAVTTSSYVKTPFNAALLPASVADIHSVTQIVTTDAQLQSLLAYVTALETGFETLKIELYNGGFITNI